MKNMFKKFLIGTLAVVAFVVTANLALASYDFGSTILKVGSKGQYVTTLQNLVGATPADGIFGPKTKAKVVAWQVAHGLTADGLFGNLSKAKTNETGTNFGAGCTNASGFSITTGFACSSLNANTFPAGCTNASGFSITTGFACNSLSAHTFPAGCTNASGFSTTTGYLCLTGLLATTTPIIRGGGSSGGSSHHRDTTAPTATFSTPTYDGTANTLTIFGTLSGDATATVHDVVFEDANGDAIEGVDTSLLGHFAPGFAYDEAWTNATLVAGVLVEGVNTAALATLAPGAETVVVTFTFEDAAGNTKDADFTWNMGDITAPTATFSAPVYNDAASTLTIYGTLSEDATATVEAVSLKNAAGTEIGTSGITAQLGNFRPGFAYDETWTNAMLTDGVLVTGVDTTALNSLASGVRTIAVTFTFEDAAGNTKDANFTWVITAPVIATTSTIVTGTVNPTFTVTGTNFKSDIVPGDLIVGDHTNGSLSFSGVTYTSGTQITVSLAGTVGSSGYVTIQARASAFNPAGTSASNELAVSVTASTLIPRTSGAYTTSTATANIRITLTSGTFKAGQLTATDFTFIGTDASKIAAGTFGVTTSSDTIVTITGLSGLTGGTDNTVTVLGATQATQAASVAATVI